MHKFYAEIQDGHLSTRRLCGQKSLSKSLYLESFPDKCVLEIYAEFPDGHQKWGKNDFWQKVPDDSADYLGVKKIVEITLTPSISKINGFNWVFPFHTKIQDGQKWWGKRILAKSAIYSGGKKFHRNRLSRIVSKINAFKIAAKMKEKGAT